MPGIGDSWGTREELLHPRDSKGRFRKSWRMADDVISRLLTALSNFRPRMFPSDGAAAQYGFNQGQLTPARFQGGEDLHRLRVDFAAANHALRRGGSLDPSTQRFVKMMDANKRSSDDDLIVSKVVDPSAFGLSVDSLPNIEEMTGKLIADRGYGAGRVGTPHPGDGQPGRILLTVATPKGTDLIFPGENRNDRRVFFDRNQELRITRVKPDGQGGYYVYAVAQPRTPGETPEPMRNLSPSDITPQQREEAIARAQESARVRMKAITPAQLQREQQQSRLAEARQAEFRQQRQVAQQAPTPAGIGRTEPQVTPALGQGAGAPGAAPIPTPAAPEGPPVVDLRAEVRAASLRAPSTGRRRVQWNDAYLGVISGKKHPEDAVRELDSDIASNRRELENQRRAGGDTTSLDEDIKLQEQLRDLIVEKYGLEPAKQAPKAPGAPEERDVNTSAAKADAANVRDKIINERMQGNLTDAQAAQQLRDQRDAAPEEAKGIFDKQITFYENKAKEAGGAIPSTEKAKPSAAEAIPEKATIADLRGIAKERGIKIPSRLTRKTDIRDYLERGGEGEAGGGAPTQKAAKATPPKVAGKATSAPVPTAPGEQAVTNLDKMTIAQLREEAARRGIKIPSSLTRKADILAYIKRGGKAPEVSPPADGEGVPVDKMTIAQLREEAKRRGIKIPSSATRKADIKAHIEGTKAPEEKAPASKTPAPKTPTAAPKATEPKAPAPSEAATLQKRSDISVHPDSELGRLWESVPKRTPEEIAFANKINDLGESLSSPAGRSDTNRPQAVLDELKKLRGEAPESVRSQLDKAIENLDAPPIKTPSLPDGVPEDIRTIVARLAGIPAARRTGQVGNSHRDESVLNEIIQIIKNMSNGEYLRGGEFESKLTDALRSLHESAEGAYQMWDLAGMLRKAGPAIREWLTVLRRGGYR